MAGRIRRREEAAAAPAHFALAWLQTGQRVTRQRLASAGAEHTMALGGPMKASGRMDYSDTTCLLCVGLESSFYEDRQLRLHYKTCHLLDFGLTSLPRTLTEMFDFQEVRAGDMGTDCTLCDKRGWKDAADLQAHKALTHVPYAFGRHECPKCGYKFVMMEHAVKHAEECGVTEGQVTLAKFISPAAAATAATPSLRRYW